MKNTHGMHHFHKRKRIHEKFEPYPHPDKWKRLLDHLIYIIGIIGPIMTIPQITKVWVEKNAAGVSAISWFSYMIISFIWIIYGIAHREKPIIIIYIIWIFLDGFVAIGAMLYG